MGEAGSYQEAVSSKARAIKWLRLEREQCRIYSKNRCGNNYPFYDELKIGEVFQFLLASYEAPLAAVSGRYQATSQRPAATKEHIFL